MLLTLSDSEMCLSVLLRWGRKAGLARLDQIGWVRLAYVILSAGRAAETGLWRCAAVGGWGGVHLNNA